MKRVIASPIKRIRKLFPLLLLIVMQVAHAQDAYPPITAENAAQITQLQRLGNGVPRMFALTDNGARLAVATTLGVWTAALPASASTEAPDMRLLDVQGGAASVLFSPDGTQIAAGGDDGSVTIWKTEDGSPVARLENHLYAVRALAWAQNHIASGDNSGVVRVWDTATWSEVLVLPSNDPISRLFFHAAGTQLTVFSGYNAVTWAITGEFLSQGEAPANLGYTLRAEAAERTALYNADSGQVEIWDKNQRVMALDGFYGEMGSVAFTDDGRVVGGESAPEYAWQVETGEHAGTPLDTPPITSPDGTRIATFGSDGVIRLRDAATGDEIAALHGHIRAVKAVAFSPDGTMLASASNDGTIGIWDAAVTEDSAPLVMLSGHSGGVTSVAFNAEGTLLASAGYDGTVRLWGIPR